jgi:hypothetical protein
MCLTGRASSSSILIRNQKEGRRTTDSNGRDIRTRNRTSHKQETDGHHDGQHYRQNARPFEKNIRTMSGTIIRGTLKAPNSQLVTPISMKLQRPDGRD